MIVQPSKPSYSKLSTVLLVVVAGVLLLAYLYELVPYEMRERHYPAAHTAAEVFSMVIAGGLFMLAWNTRRHEGNHYLLWLGIAYGFVGILDLLHTMSYKGIALELSDTGTATELWIAARGTQALALLAAPLFIRRRINVWVTALGFLAVTLILAMSVLVWGNFPACFEDGLTPFKIISEYVISGILLISAGFLILRRTAFDRQIMHLLVASIAMTIISELVFTLYNDPFATPNMVGHVFKIVAFALLYKAFIQTAFRRPMDLLFRELKQRESSLEETRRRQERLIEAMRKVRSALEVRVQERTSQLRNTVMRLQAEVQDRIKAQDTLREQSRILELFTRKYSRQDYLKSVTDAVRDWSGCRCVGIRVRDEDEIYYESYVGFNQQFWEKEKTLRLGVDQCACTRVVLGQTIPCERKHISAGGSFFCSDIRKLMDTLDEHSKCLYRGECVKFGYRSIMIVPVRYRDQILGVMHLTDERPGLATPEAAAFLESIAPLIGEAINRLNIEQERRRLETQVLSISESERQRIGQDLHDSLGQTLSGIGYLAAALTRRLADKSLPEAKDVEKLEQIIDNAVAMTRRLARGLTPVGIRGDSLTTGLKDLATSAEEMFDINCTVQHDQVVINDSTVATHLYRIAQEALTNAVKHGKAQRVEIELTKAQKHVSLKILDNGIGIEDENERPSEGLGLRIMKYRAGMFGATLDVHRVQPHGTVVHCSFNQSEQVNHDQ